MPDGSAASEGAFLADAAGEQPLRGFRALAGAVDDGVYQLDAEGRFRAVNDALLETTGHDRDALVGSHVSAVLEDDAVERLEERRRDGLADEATGFDATVETADGGAVLCELQLLDSVDEGEGRGVVGLLRQRVDRDAGEEPFAVDRGRWLEQYRVLTEAANDVIVTIDEDSVIQTVNPAIEDVFGYEPEAVIGESLTMLMPEALADRHREGIERYLETGERTLDWEYVELPGVRADGTEITLAVSFSDVEHGEERYFTGILRDVTEHKEREREHELFRTLLDHSNDVLLVVDPESGRLLDSNDTACERLGYSREELLQLSVPDIETSFPEIQDWRSHVRDLRREGSLTIPGTHRRKDGSTFPVEVNVSYVELDRAYVVAIARDVTESRQRQQELEQYETIVETIPDGAYVLDEEHRFTLVNETLVEMTGHTREELLDSDAELISTDGGHERGLELREQLKSGEIDVAVLEEEIQTAAGDTFDAEIRFDALYGEEGSFRGTAGVIRDISGRKEYERKLEESNERLEQFAYAASHDLQEPLRMVTSYLQLLERRYADDLDDDAEEFIEFAVDGAERMREMIDGLLEYSRVETRGDPFEPVDLDDVLDDVLADLQLQIEERDADVTSEPLPTVEGDAGQLRQVFQNLLDNAIEYSGDEPPRAHVDAERAGDRWIVSVEDEGIGIDPGDADRVFEVFQRLHGHEEHEGTGIGLALCRRIVERHGGEIRVESQPGEGSTFYVTLPAADGPAE